MAAVTGWAVAPRPVHAGDVSRKAARAASWGSSIICRHGRPLLPHVCLYPLVYLGGVIGLDLQDTMQACAPRTASRMRRCEQACILRPSCQLPGSPQRVSGLLSQPSQPTHSPLSEPAASRLSTDVQEPGILQRARHWSMSAARLPFVAALAPGMAADTRCLPSC